VTYIIAEPCVDVLDKACIEECPVDCIYEGGRMLYIHPDECVDCGACEPVCPVEAIFYEDDVPEEWSDYTKANYDFFGPTEDSEGKALVVETIKEVDEDGEVRFVGPANKPYSKSIGSPGGASKVGGIKADYFWVRELPEGINKDKH
jgi:NAD-dependent dihydropyrimidine dehydrogenase PreA subunit